MNLGNGTTSVFYDRLYAKDNGSGNLLLGLLTSGSTAANAGYGSPLNYGHNVPYRGQLQLRGCHRL